MEWLSNLTNGENGSAINLVLITLAIAILLIVIVWIFRKMTGTAARRAMRSRVPRLSITDSTTVDEKRYLVMVRRDNVEHLLLIGGANDLVVESNIVRAQTAQKPVANTQTSIKHIEAHEPTKSSKNDIGIAAPVAGTAAIGAAGIAAATSATNAAAASASDITSDAASGISEAASSAKETISANVGDVVEATRDTISDTASNVADAASDMFDNVTETVSANAEPVADIDIPEVSTEGVSTENIEIAEMDLESTISAKLDDALSAENLDINVEEPAIEADSTIEDPQSGSDDEMQRLLDELSGETKEPAQ